MAEFKSLPMAKILVPADRLRAVEEDHALMISQSIARRGMFHPITVRPTPAAERPYTLSAGAHRMRATEILNRPDIDCLVMKAGAIEGQLIEIEENVFKNPLSALDRAIFIRRYRELWEEEHGKITRGNPDLPNSAKLAELDIDSAPGDFFLRVHERMGLSRRAIERSQFIAKSLLPDLREAVRGTAISDNQSQIEKLAGLDPERQQKIAVLFRRDHDLAAALEHTDPTAQGRARRTAAQKRGDTVVTNFAALGKDDRRELLRRLIRDYPEDAGFAWSNPLGELA